MEVALSFDCVSCGDSGVFSCEDRTTLGRGKLSNEDVLSQLAVKRGVRDYCIGTTSTNGNEDVLHADPADPLLDEHKHVYVYFLERAAAATGTQAHTGRAQSEEDGEGQ